MRNGSFHLFANVYPEINSCNFYVSILGKIKKFTFQTAEETVAIVTTVISEVSQTSDNLETVSTTEKESESIALTTNSLKSGIDSNQNEIQIKENATDVKSVEKGI